MFAKGTPLVGAPHRWRVRPIKALKHPSVWWQGRNGSRCPSCERRAAEAAERQERLRQIHQKRRELQARVEEERRERRAQAERERRARREREERMSSPEYLAQEPRMLEVTRRSLEALGVDPLWAAERGVFVRHCEHCAGLTALVNTRGLTGVPPEAQGAFVVSNDGSIRCRCSLCGQPCEDNPDRYKVWGDDLAGYELRPEAVRSLATS